MHKRIMAGILVVGAAVGLNTFYVLFSKPVQAMVTSQPPEYSYLVIPGIKGDSTVVKGAIDVSQVSYQTITHGQTSYDPISFLKNYDSSTTQLLAHLTTGQSVTGDVYYARTILGSKPVVYFDLHFKGVLNSDEMTDVGEKIEITPTAEKITYGGLLGPLAGNLPEVTRATFLPLIALAGFGLFALVRKRKAKRTDRQ